MGRVTGKEKLVLKGDSDRVMTMGRWERWLDGACPACMRPGVIPSREGESEGRGREGRTLQSYAIIGQDSSLDNLQKLDEVFWFSVILADIESGAVHTHVLHHWANSQPMVKLLSGSF